MIQRILRSVLLHDQKRICALLSYNFCFNTRTYLIQHDTRRKGHGVRTTQSKSPPVCLFLGVSGIFPNSISIALWPRISFIYWWGRDKVVIR